MDTVTLERMKFIVLQYLNQELVDQFAIEPEVEFTAHAYFMCDDIVLRIKQAVYGRTMERVEVKYPRDWWEAVKDRWLPEWAKARWPVKYQCHTLTATEFYPKISEPRLPYQLQLAKHDYVMGYADED